jgi:hypothetical protein
MNSIIIGKKLLTQFVIYMMLVSCSQVQLEPDHTYIRGRVFFTDERIKDVTNEPLGEVEVQLLKNSSSDTTNFLYSAKSNKDGYFLLKLLEAGRGGTPPSNYRVRVEAKIGDYYYYGSKEVGKNNNEVILNVNLNTAKHNGLDISVVDVDGDPLSKATVRVYTSKVLSEANEEVGAIKSLQADSRGKASILDLEPDQYYINVSLKVGNTVLEKKGNAVTVGETGIVSKEIMIQE